MASCLRWRETASGFLQVSVHQRWGVFSVSSPSWKVTTPVYQTNNESDLIILIIIKYGWDTAPPYIFAACRNAHCMRGTMESGTTFNTAINPRLTTLLIRGKGRVLHCRQDFTHWEDAWFSETELLHTEVSEHSASSSASSSPSAANSIITNSSNDTFLTKEKPNQYLLKKSSAKGYITTRVFLDISNNIHKYLTLFPDRTRKCAGGQRAPRASHAHQGRARTTRICTDVPWKGMRSRL